MKRLTRPNAAFTLIELLVVVSVIAVLAAILLPAISSVRTKASMSREISSARQLMSAYAAYAADNDGELMAGFGDFPAKDDRGQDVHNPVNARYPWRIAPYLKYEMRVLWGSTADDRLSKAKQGPHDSYVYAVSVEPALGVNAAFVGGDYQVLPPNKEKAVDRYGLFCVTRLAQASQPHDLIVFASAGSIYEGQRMQGYFKVEAPNFTSRTWKRTYSASDSPEVYGHVDFRWNGKAVAAMLDGHVELLDFEQMNDMRRWSNLAATANSDNWTLGMSDEQTSSNTGVNTGTHVDANPTNEKP